MISTMTPEEAAGILYQSIHHHQVTALKNGRSPKEAVNTPYYRALWTALYSVLDSVKPDPVPLQEAAQALQNHIDFREEFFSKPIRVISPDGQDLGPVILPSDSDDILLAEKTALRCIEERLIKEE